MTVTSMDQSGELDEWSMGPVIWAVPEEEATKTA